jgi:proteasome lid subunit RPN8/RPN11
MTVLHLSETLRDNLIAVVRQGYPEETCGLLLGRRSGAERVVVQVRQARNLNRERAQDRYELDPEDYLAADRDARAEGLDVVGIWHSHPDHPAKPSATDLASAWPGWSYLIVAIGRAGVRDIRCWGLNGDDFQEEEIKT